ncbi:MAG: AAA-like domain-containing protein [Chloroflexota bacterium]
MTTIPPRTQEFFVVGGTLKPDAPSYVKRAADDELYELVLRNQFAYVLTSRQMGKSSLMARTAQRLETEADVRTARIDLTLIGTQQVETWYRSLIENIARDLRLATDLEAWWQSQTTPNPVQRFHHFFSDVVLTELDGPVVIFIDEIDFTIQLDFSDDFFAAIRGLHNDRAKNPAFERLTFVLLGTASPTDLIKERTRTPFNIGTRIILEDFSAQDATVLEDGLEKKFPHRGEQLFAQVYTWTNGHPYLTQKLCQQIVQSDTERWKNPEIDHIVDEHFLSDKAIKEDNLQFVQDQILKYAKSRSLLTLYRRVYSNKPVADKPQSITHNQLKLSGIVKTVDGRLEVRNQIYRDVFDPRWIQQHMQINWTPIIAMTLGVVLFLIMIGFGYEFWITQDIQANFGKFHQTRVAAERVEYMANILQHHRLFGSTEHHDQVQQMFFDLSYDEQLALFGKGGQYTMHVEHSDLVLITQAIYYALADVDGMGHTDELLSKMHYVLKYSHPTEETQLVIDEIYHWQNGRSYAKKGNYEDSLEEYSRALAKNQDNLAILYEKTRVHIQWIQNQDNLNEAEKTEQYSIALNELDKILGVVKQEPTPTPTPTSLPTHTSTSTSTLTSTPIVQSPLPTPTSTLIAQSPLQTSTSTPIVQSPLQTLTQTPTPTPLFISSLNPPTSLLTVYELPTQRIATSLFRTIGQRIAAVERLLNDYPDLAHSLYQSPRQYDNLVHFGLIPTVTSTPAPTVTSTRTPVPEPTTTIRPTSTPTTTPPPNLAVVGDDYESDNVCEQATLIEPNGFPHLHTFHQFNDQDWVKFVAPNDGVYRIEVTVPVNSRADVDQAYFLGCDGPAKGEWSASFAAGVLFDISAEPGEQFYIKSKHSDSEIFGADVSYEISVREKIVPFPFGPAIIVAGRYRMDDPLQKNIEETAEKVYELFLRHKGGSGHDILFLSTQDGLWTDMNATTENLEYAIKTWPHEKEGRISADSSLTLYLIGLGIRDQFYIDGTQDDSGLLTTQELDAWLTSLETQVPGLRVNVIIESSYSGSFIHDDGYGERTTISREGRLIITSTDHRLDAYIIDGGIPFSDALIEYFQNDDGSLAAAFDYAKKRIQTEFPWQYPWIDGDGDGVPNEPEDMGVAAQLGFDNSP